MLDNGSWGRRAFNFDYIIAAKPYREGSISITTAIGEFEIEASLEDLMDRSDIDPLQVFSDVVTGGESHGKC